MRNQVIKSMAVVVALSVAAITFSQSAEAGKRGRNFGLGLGLGIAGLAIGSALANPGRHYGNRYYDDDYRGPRTHYRRHYNRPYYRTHYYADDYVPRRRAHRGRPRPWSSAWYRYCANKYRSFNASNGTFQPYNGSRRLCR